ISVNMCTFKPPFFFPSPLGFGSTFLITSEKNYGGGIEGVKLVKTDLFFPADPLNFLIYLYP
ncbi:MAG TPA: hypothetical protein PLO46_07920, partial [Bacteroidales bacterium]|nr:hypothetical protein [Bacteroidales bacterium]HPN49593.1 hypothetical protein [Bacteroidales bacterium]HQI64233.1 hypothetical protein [Bacteroidales bacterium]HQQ42895.1 hypothetical protein [Bacteroidales bacterium]